MKCLCWNTLFWMHNLKHNIIALWYNSWCRNIISHSFPIHGILEFHNHKATVSQNCVSLSCKKNHCKPLWMRNWFWLRSSHPFSLFTILQPTFSSTSEKFPSCQPRSVPTPRSLPSAARIDCGAVGAWGSWSKPLPCTVPPGHGSPTPALRSPLTTRLALLTHPAARSSSLYLLLLFPSQFCCTGLTFPLQSDVLLLFFKIIFLRDTSHSPQPYLDHISLFSVSNPQIAF